MNLRGLDERLLPALARGLARVLAPGRPRTDREQPPPPPLTPRTPPAPLLTPPSPPPTTSPPRTPEPRRPPRARRPRRPPRAPGPWRTRLGALDDRFARRGLLGHLRTTPVTALTLTVALLLAAAVAAVHVAGRPDAAPADAGDAPVAAAVPASCPVGTAAGSAYVGPSLGADVPAYVTAQATTVARCVKATPGATLSAVISLTAAETPMQAAEALRGVSLQEVFVQLPATPRTPYLLPLSGASDGVVRVDAAILTAYAAAQAAFLADRGEQLAHGSVAVTAAKAALRAAADRDELAAAQLRTGCACTYAAIAVGTVAQLAALRTSDVSVIALAPAGVSAAKITARPLLPSETTALQPSALPRALVAGSIP